VAVGMVRRDKRGNEQACEKISEKKKREFGDKF
jgi:hypothetical protein